MNVWVSARIAMRALRVNKLRSVLTMLGIIIGVGAVITMVGVGAGAQARIAEEIQSLGSNLIIVLAGTVTSGGVRLGTGSKVSITEDDAWAIQREVPSVEVAAPSVQGKAQDGQVAGPRASFATVACRRPPSLPCPRAARGVARSQDRADRSPSPRRSPGRE